MISDMVVIWHPVKDRMHGLFRRWTRLAYSSNRSANPCSGIAPLMDSLTKNRITLSLPHNSR